MFKPAGLNGIWMGHTRGGDAMAVHELTGRRRPRPPATAVRRSVGSRSRTGQRAGAARHLVVLPRGRPSPLLGANGSGKTTTIRAASGLLPLHQGRITAGEVRLDGQSVNGERAHKIVAQRRRAGARGPDDLRAADRRREPARSAPPAGAAAGRRRRSSRSSSSSRSCASASTTARGTCPAASSRCWRSGAR